MQTRSVYLCLYSNILRYFSIVSRKIYRSTPLDKFVCNVFAKPSVNGPGKASTASENGRVYSFKFREILRTVSRRRSYDSVTGRGKNTSFTAYLSDTNRELMNSFVVVRDFVGELIKI